jgi:hypothetical protein
MSTLPHSHTFSGVEATSQNLFLLFHAVSISFIPMVDFFSGRIKWTFFHCQKTVTEECPIVKVWIPQRLQE